jgi:hypothetical protein
VADCFEVTRRQGYAQVRGGPPLERPGHQRFERWQRTEQAGVDDLGKRDVLGPFGSTRRDPLILELRSAPTLHWAYRPGLWWRNRQILWIAGPA